MHCGSRGPIVGLFFCLSRLQTNAHTSCRWRWSRAGYWVHKSKCRSTRKHKNKKPTVANTHETWRYTSIKAPVIQIYRGISRCELHGIYPIVVGCWKNIKKRRVPKKRRCKFARGRPYMLTSMLQKQVWTPVELKAETKSYNGLFSQTGSWSVQEIIHCTKSVFFEQAFKKCFLGKNHSGRAR